MQLQRHRLYARMQQAEISTSIAGPSAVEDPMADLASEAQVKLQTLASVVALVYAERFYSPSDQRWVQKAIADGLGVKCLLDDVQLDLTDPRVIKIGSIYMLRAPMGELSF